SGTIKAENPSALLDFKSQIALDYPLDEVRVREDDENWFLRSSGYLTYSVNEQNLRHSYGWWTASGGLAITPNYWISSTFVLQKYSFSYTIGDGSDFKENFGLRVFPLFTYRGTFNQFLNPYEPEKGKCLVDAEAGTLSRAQLGLGLTYAEFDGLGIRSRTQCSIIGFELAVLGSGYDSADDIVGVHLDLWERLIQAGVVLELVNSFGSRATPTLGSHWQTFSWLQLYFEAGCTLQWNTSGKTIIFNEGDVKNEKILISDRFLSPNAKIDKSTTAALMGFKLDFSKWLPNWLKAENIAEIRYYGREYNNFYEISRFEGFNQPYFAFSDLASNRQPRNFFVRNGEVSGAFVRQDISLRSWDKLEI
ncbi:MAG: hypothetical protein KDK38_16760, partial [Leptospiraceae bacterium]|nr:hypothetical protein [Leptospiraceae bacterium]